MQKKYSHVLSREMDVAESGINDKRGLLQYSEVQRRPILWENIFSYRATVPLLATRKLPANVTEKIHCAMVIEKNMVC
jgi:hypothetical protein